MAYTPTTLKTCGMNGRYVMSVNPDPDSCREWTYLTADAMTTVRAANYITDARARGMQPGDIVTVVTRATPGATPTAVTQAVVLTVGASGADLSDGSALTLTNT